MSIRKDKQGQGDVGLFLRVLFQKTTLYAAYSIQGIPERYDAAFPEWRRLYCWGCLLYQYDASSVVCMHRLLVAGIGATAADAEDLR